MEPHLWPLVALYEDGIVAVLVLWDVLARETAKALLDCDVAILGDIDVRILPSAEYLHRGQSDRDSKGVCG